MKVLRNLPRTDIAQASRAFTLIELMVAMSLFTVVILVGVGALLSLTQMNKRAQAIDSVMNNLNAAVESMSRSIRVGTNYYCGTVASPPTPSTLASPLNCSGSGGVLLAFESPDGDPTDVDDQVVYRLNGTQLERSLCSGVNQTCSGGDKNGAWVALTAPEVSIDYFNFYVIGSPRGDGVQPRVLMRIKGSAQTPGGTTTFTVQSGVVQRLIDL